MKNEYITAQEAADIANEKNKIYLEVVFEKIEKFARSGKRSVKYYQTTMNFPYWEVMVEAVKQNGFQINEGISSDWGDKFIEISW